MLVRFRICERVSQLREMDCRNVNGKMRVHCPLAILCFSEVGEKYWKTSIKVALLIFTKGYTGAAWLKPVRGVVLAKIRSLRLLRLLSVWPQSHQKKGKATSAGPSFLLIRIHYQKIDILLPPKSSKTKQ